MTLTHLRHLIIVPRTRLAVLVAVCLVLVAVYPVAAKPTFSSIDGLAADWSDTTCMVDGGGVDDEAAPVRADINQFCAHVDATYFYVAMAWDNTAFTGGNTSTAGARLDIDGDGLFDFMALGTLAGNPVSIQKYSIGSCPGGSCTNADDVCASDGSGGGPCTGALAAVSTAWDDPFDPTPGHGGGSPCGGTGCTTSDAFIELAVPWSVLGLSGPPNPHVFGDFGSYPSGPAQAPKDDIAGGNGISCTPAGFCWVSTPTAILLSRLGTGSGESAWAATVLFVTVGMMTLLIFLLRGRRPDSSRLPFG